MERLSPFSVHLLAQLIRHKRGMLTAWEKWAWKQPRCPMQAEFLKILAVERGELLDEEKRLSKIDVESPEVVSK